MKKMKKELIGSIVAIPMEDGDFCYGRIIEDFNYAFYDYKTNFKENKIEDIVQKEILFVAMVNYHALEEGNWEILGKLPLDDRHKKMPVFYEADLMNHKIYDYTVNKIKQTLVYKTYENGGLQDGGVYSASTIQDRLKDYYDGKDYSGITNLLFLMDNLKEFHSGKPE